MNTSLPSQSLHVGPPSSSGRSFLPSHQGPKPNRTHRASPVDSTSRPAPRVRQKALLGKQAVICGATIPQIPGVPHGKMPMALSFASPKSGHQASPGPGAAPIPPLSAGPPAFASPKHSALEADTHRNPPMGSHASTQAARPAGTSNALASPSAAAPQRPGPVARICPKNRQLQSTCDKQVTSTSRLTVSYVKDNWKDRLVPRPDYSHDSNEHLHTK